MARLRRYDGWKGMEATMTEEHIKKISDYIEMILIDMTGTMEIIMQIQRELREMEGGNETVQKNSRKSDWKED